MRAWIRRHRWIAMGLAALMLAGQVAASGYACTLSLADVAVPQAGDCGEHAVAAAGTGEAAPPLLCKAHCEGGQTSLNSAGTAASVPPPALLDARWLRAGDPAVASQAEPAPAALEWTGPPAGAPPLYLSLLVLRN
jgi:hypothetical protein